ncbi:TIGR02646 family protein [Neorhizobium galegae bv. officinalis bv. officinalis str. HAMBI 1141]|uniref:TIGR02646 family protein n=1 Tax=Neorhizobium galegae bv. officinalis bv. officinalis str. HAMBI 1141 TaxID=1028801 RepID=A0A068TEG1_NEOGA|nr:HNH endonuclease signature motif containing protein [Neorhizobium galegae]CDN56514.1 TIGR02646 family protein [Neorhizobium galegae bv. officinalis bv. officinalis str. HAMBI 1141]
MRNLDKLPIPEVLNDNWIQWTEQYKSDKTSATKKYRYRHSDIKSTLVEETKSKCAYCESKIGHNTPGDVEHKTPSSVNIDLHFDWTNLTIACTECNRRKLTYFDAQKPFLDPYDGDVENRVIHLGPVVGWQPGDEPAEISVRTLELHDNSRAGLIKRKIEAIDHLNNLVARYHQVDGVMKELLLLSIQKLKSKEAEYSGMLKAVCDNYGI